LTTTTIPYRFRLRRGLAAALASLNEILLDGEAGWAKDARNFKVGDGSTAFNSLPWILPPWDEAGGTGNALTVTYTDKPVPFDGMLIRLRATAANTGAATLNVNGLGAIDIEKRGGSALSSGDIAGAGCELLLVYVDATSPHWELLNPAIAAGSAAGMVLVGTATVTGSAATTLALSGLDLATDERYFIEAALDNATGSAADISFFYSGDTTATNYYRQSESVSGSGQGSSRVNNAVAIGLPASETASGNGWLMKDRDGKTRLRFGNNQDQPNAIVLQNFAQAWNSTSNVTSITLSSSVASALAVGSYIKVWKLS